MGYFSFVVDNESLPVRLSTRYTFPVVMLSNCGTGYYEPNYEGYGVFGGKDYHVLLAEMNNVKAKDEEALRLKGIDLYFSRKRDVLKPRLFRFVKGQPWPAWQDLKDPVDCKCQGYFYM